MSMKLFNMIHEGLHSTEEAIMRSQMKAEVYSGLLQYMDSDECHSEWQPDGNGGYTCSTCGFNYNAGGPETVFNFCPACGDRMIAAVPQESDKMEQTVETGGPIEVIEGD